MDLTSPKLRIAIIFTVGFFFRMLQINHRPLWYDEAFAVLFAEKGPSAMINGTLSTSSGVSADVHPLGYYSVLWIWMKVFGEKPLALRGLSVIFGMLTLVVIYLLCKSMYKEKLAQLLTLGVAISPFHIHFSQEIRMYSLMAFFLILSTWSLWQAIQTRRTKWWIIFSLASALAQYSHNLALFYLIPLAFTPFIFRKWQTIKPMLLSILGSILIYTPWLVNLPGQFGKVIQSYWITRPSVDRLVTTLLTYVTNLPIAPVWMPVALFVTFFILFISIWQTIRAIRAHHETAVIGSWLAYLAFSPAILLFLFSQWKPVYIERGLLPSGIMFILWAGWAVFETILHTPIRWFVVGLFITGAILGIYQHITYRGFPYAEFEQIDRSIKLRSSTNDLILHSNKLSMLPAYYYDRNLAQFYLADPPGSGADTLSPATQQVLGLLASPSLDQVVNNADRVWFIIYKQAILEYKQTGAHNHPHIEWLDTHYHLDHVESWDDLLIYLYTR